MKLGGFDSNSFGVRTDRDNDNFVERIIQLTLGLRAFRIYLSLRGPDNLGGPVEIGILHTDFKNQKAQENIILCINSLDEMINLRCKMVKIHAMVFVMAIFHFEVRNQSN